MATFAADILSVFSGPPGDGGIRHVRDTSLNSAGSRKKFSSVLRSVRGEARGDTVRQAEDPRPVNNTDSGSAAKGTNEPKNSPRFDKADASSQTTEKVETTKRDEKLTDETKTGSESSARQTDSGSGLQDQGTLPLSGLMFVSNQPPVADEAHVQTETDPHILGDETSVDTSTAHPLISDESSDTVTTTPETNGNHFSPNRMGGMFDPSSTQLSHRADSSMNDGEGNVPGVGAEVTEVIEDSGRIAVDLSEATPVQENAIPTEPPRFHDSGIPQVPEAYVQSPSLEGSVLAAKIETAPHGPELADHSVSSLAARQVPAIGDHHSIGTGMEQSFTEGRQFGREGSAQFAELWPGPNGRQMDTGEPKLSQPFVVDPTIVTGSVADSTVPGSSRQAISLPGTPAPTSFVSQVPPGSKVEDTAQSTGLPTMRSVVVNVTQPDLGHVNIRVAMTNDVVHTHFSSDRLEVGQFIVNGQDRLQAALQSSGMDMGQFRVDIDRQSGGRSFQQSASQDHGQSWSQGSDGMGQESRPDQQNPMRGTLPGLLNVVA
ncbi:MAG: flagellar hook-length control protein FliK [Nitrospira sp.]|nr:flagellar hook-length control protein FliK [Nitrospira sp.]